MTGSSVHYYSHVCTTRYTWYYTSITYCLFFYKNDQVVTNLEILHPIRSRGKGGGEGPNPVPLFSHQEKKTLMVHSGTLENDLQLPTTTTS